MSLLIGAVALTIGCGSGTIAPLAPANAPTSTMLLSEDHPAYFRGNEHFHANVALLGIEAGELDASISETCDAKGRPTSALMLATMRTSGVVRLIIRRDSNSSTRLDGVTAKPAVQTMEVYDGGPVRRYYLKFSPGRMDFVFRKGTEPEQKGMRTALGREPVFDMQSAVVVLRSWRPKPGSVGHFNVALGRAVWQLEAVFRGPTKLNLDNGERRAVWIEGIAREISKNQISKTDWRHVRMWFSDDADRLPLRIAADADYGTAEFTLDDHERLPGGCVSE